MPSFTDKTYGEPTQTIYAPCYSVFQSSLRDENTSYVLVFEPVKKISLKGKIYDFSQLTGYSISVNPAASSITKASTGSVLGRAAVGGILLGGVGALIGASTAKTKTEYESRTIITIFTNSLNEPSIVLDLIAPDKEKIAQIEGILRIITSNPPEPIANEQSIPQERLLKMGDFATIKKNGREVIIIDIKEEDGKNLYLVMDDDETCYYSQEELECNRNV